METMTAPASAQDGVNLDAGDSFSRYAARVCQASYKNSRYIEVTDRSQGLFRGPRTCRHRHLALDCEFSLESDGNGTKPIIIPSLINPSILFQYPFVSE